MPERVGYGVVSPRIGNSIYNIIPVELWQGAGRKRMSVMTKEEEGAFQPPLLGLPCERGQVLTYSFPFPSP